MSIFKDKTLLITGGTGSFGNAVLRRFWIPILRRSVSLAVMRKTGRYASSVAKSQSEVLYRECA